VPTQQVLLLLLLSLSQTVYVWLRRENLEIKVGEQVPQALSAAPLACTRRGYVASDMVHTFVSCCTTPTHCCKGKYIYCIYCTCYFLRASLKILFPPVRGHTILENITAVLQTVDGAQIQELSMASVSHSLVI
jgi:hypothetical protein